MAKIEGKGKKSRKLAVNIRKVWVNCSIKPFL